MKKMLLSGLVSILLLPLLMVGCVSSGEDNPAAAKSQGVIVTLDDLSANPSILKYAEMTYPGTLTVRLGSNQTTGYSWAVTQIEHPSVMTQLSNTYEGPTDTNIVGAGGTEVWKFSAADKGLAIIRMSYSRQWEGGGKGYLYRDSKRKCKIKIV